MKLEQEPKFQPITLVLGTKKEAETLWEIVRCHQSDDLYEINFCQEIAHWFSNEAQL